MYRLYHWNLSSSYNRSVVHHEHTPSFQVVKAGKTYPQEMESSQKLLATCQTGLAALLTRLLGLSLDSLQTEMEEHGFKESFTDINS